MKKLIIAGVLLVAMAGGWWLGRPAYRAHKEKKFTAQAETEMEKRRYREAAFNARQVLALNSNNLVATRVMADLADMSRSPNAIFWRRRIAELEPNLTNRTILASCALRYEQPPFPVAAQTLKQIGQEGERFAPFHVVSAQLALKQNRIADAEKHFETAIRLDPTNELNRLNLAVVRLQSKDSAISASAHAQVETMQSSAQWGDYALRSLAQHHMERMEFERAQEFSEKLLKHANVSFMDRLQHLTLLHQRRSPEFTSYLAWVKAEAGTNAVAAFELANRLTALREPESALSWLKALKPEVQNTMPLPMAFANAFEALKDWQGLEAYLKTQGWKELDFLRLATLARAVRHQNDPEVSRVYWGKALQAASERPESLAMLAQLVGSWRWNAEAEETLWHVMKAFPQERWAFDALQAGYGRELNTRGLYRLYSALLDRQPTNALAQNNVAALGMLLGTNVDRAHKLAVDAYRANTNHFGYVSTYAWSLHLQGRTAEALQLMESLDERYLSDPSVASYYGVLLAAAGQKEKAQVYLAKSEQATVLPEEKAMVAETRKRMR